MKGTLFASGGNCSVLDALKGTHPLNTAPPPRVLGYKRTLANVNAPGKTFKIHMLQTAMPTKCSNHRERERETSLTKSTHKYIIRIGASSYLLVDHLMHVLNCFKQAPFIFWRILECIINLIEKEMYKNSKYTGCLKVQFSINEESKQTNNRATLVTRRSFLPLNDMTMTLYFHIISKKDKMIKG